MTVRKGDPLRERDGYYWVEDRFVDRLGKKIRVQKTTHVRVVDAASRQEALVEHGKIMSLAYVKHGRKEVGVVSERSIAQAFDANRKAKRVADRAANTMRILDQSQAPIVRILGADTSVAILTTELYIDYADQRKNEDAANATIRRELRELNFGIKKLGLAPPVIPDVGRMGECTRALTIDETRRVLIGLRDDWDEETADAFVVYRTSGIRRAEIFDIDIVRWDSGMMYVDGTKTGGSKRWLPMSADVRRVFRRRLDASGRDANPFVADAGRTSGRYYGRFQSTAKRLGILPFCLNDLRRSFTTELLMANESIKKVSTLLGHKDTRMVDKHYARLFGRMEELASTVTKLADYTAEETGT